MLSPANLVRVGCAGWSIPRDYIEKFAVDGTHIERYASLFSGVEINSSFYRPHKPATYQRWAASVPGGFQFSVKIPRAITHTKRLTDVAVELGSFLGECEHLGAKLGPLLVQLPPSLVFNTKTVGTFFELMRSQFEGRVVCEPRHATWFTPEGNALLSGFHVTRVAADPALVPEAAEPGGWGGLVYYRLHGSPRIYYSAYPPNYLQSIAQKLSDMVTKGAEAWCIFDNTAEGAAIGDALTVLAHIQA